MNRPAGGAPGADQDRLRRRAFEVLQQLLADAFSPVRGLHVGMADQADLAAILDAHHAREHAVGFKAPERDALANLPLQLCERHVRLMPAVRWDDALVSLRGVVDDREERRQVGHCARSNQGHVTPGSAGVTVTGTPLNAAFPESASMRWSSVRSLRLAPECEAATESAAPSRACPQPCGRLTTPRLTSSVSVTGTSTLPTREATRARPPCAMPRAAASAGLINSEQPSGPFTRRRLLCIHELLLRSARRPISTSPFEGGFASVASSRSTSRRKTAGASCTRLRPSRAGNRGFSGPRSSPCGFRSSLRSDSRYGPNRRSRSSARRSPSIRAPRRDAPRTRPLRPPPCRRSESARSSSTSKSPRTPAGRGTSGFTYRAALRTASA